MAIRLMKQRYPLKKMGRKQRRGSKSNPRSGVQWANWLDVPGSGGQGGGPGGVGDPNIESIVPNTSALSAGAVSVTVNGTSFQPGCVIEADDAAIAATTFVSSTKLTCTVTPVTAKVYTVSVRNPNAEESNDMDFTVTAGEVQGFSAEEEDVAPPTMSNTKQEIIDWLIEFGGYEAEGLDTYTKAELLDLVEA